LSECWISGGTLRDQDTVVEDTVTDVFEGFVKETGPGLKHALMAALGADMGMEAASEALAYGWEHWGRVGVMENPGGYLYRVGRNWGGRRLRSRKPKVGFPGVSSEMPWVEPSLPEALSGLSERQRTAVVLVHGAGWSYAEVAMLMGLTRGAVHKHVERALAKLRGSLEGDREN
jgi:RNA polymerase sigma-70 factor (ECF subfamily)